MARKLLVTVDSLRYDHLSEMPETEARLDDWHENALATCTATLGSFPAIIAGEYAKGSEIDEGTSIANILDGHRVGITTNHLLSERYGYDDGFDQFDSPHSSQSIKDEVGRNLTIGSPVYRVASTLWGGYQRVQEMFVGVSKSFRPAHDVIDSFLESIEPHDDWFGWLHFMEPHYPYDPDGADVSRSKAQSMSRTVVSGDGTPEQEEKVRELYRKEVAELDEHLATLWEAVPEDTRIVFCADHGEMLGEDGLWGHPGEVRPELLHVPLGTANTPETGDLVSLIDVPSLLAGEEWGEGTFDRETAYASYGENKAAIDLEHIASEDGTMTHDGEPASAPALERRLDRFDPAQVFKEDAVKEDLEELGYV